VLSWKIKVDNNSPALDARSNRIMRDYAHEVEEQVAEFAYDQVMTELDLVLQHPTGYYESRVQVHQVGDLYQVDDDSVVYGPWLAGASERNRETRFKGYLHWRRAQQSADHEAEPIAERLFRSRYERRLES
jgi:hypothetical protein